MDYKNYKISELEKIYLQAKEDYYQISNTDSKLSDDEYDQLENYLKSKNSSVVKIVGTESNSSVYTIKHLTPMLSLEKIQYVKSFPIDDWNFWVNKVFQNSSLQKKLLFTPKLDGSSCKLIYQNGKLISAATRGNGTEGRDILSKMKLIVPNFIDFSSSDKLEIIGEVVISSNKFEQHQQNCENLGTKIPKNERNYVAGLLNQKEDEFDTSEVQNLSFVVFESRLNDGISCNLQRLEEMSFEIPEFSIFTHVSNIEEIYEKFKNFRKISKYLLDGFVTRVTDSKLVKELGEGSHHPNWSLAIKFEPTVKSTFVKNIKWQFSQSGRYTPVLEIEPLELVGTTVSNVTGNNISFLRKNGIGIGAKITVFKSGEIIPKVGDILIQSSNIECPNNCLYCQTKLEEDVHLICPNKSCVGLLPYKMEQALKRLDIKRIGPSIIEKLIAAGYPTLIDLLTESQENLKEYLVDSGEFQSGRNLDIVLEALNIKSLTTEQIILISGIDALGTSAAPQIANLFENKSYDFSGLNSEITLPFEDKNSELYKLVSENISKFEKIGKLKKSVISNLKNICLTGSPKDFGFKTKDDFMNSISGYKDSSLDKTCIALITDDLNSKSSKMLKAQKLKIPIYTYSEFLKIAY